MTFYSKDYIRTQDDLTNEIFVAKRVDAVAGDGSVSNPFSTIQAALDHILSQGDASSSNRYVVRIGPGRWVENIRIRTQYTTLCGTGKESTHITATSGFILYIGNATDASLDALEAANQHSVAGLNTNYTSLVADGSFDFPTGVNVENLTIEQYSSSYYALGLINIGTSPAAGGIGVNFNNVQVLGRSYIRNLVYLRERYSEFRYQQEQRNIRIGNLFKGYSGDLIVGFNSGEDTTEAPFNTLSSFEIIDYYTYGGLTFSDARFDIINLSVIAVNDFIVDTTSDGEIYNSNLYNLTLSGSSTFTATNVNIRNNVNTTGSINITGSFNNCNTTGDFTVENAGTQLITYNGGKIFGTITDAGGNFTYVSASVG